jgi:hypothetical protein
MSADEKLVEKTREKWPGIPDIDRSVFPANNPPTREELVEIALRWYNERHAFNMCRVGECTVCPARAKLMADTMVILIRSGKI